MLHTTNLIDGRMPRVIPRLNVVAGGDKRARFVLPHTTPLIAGGCEDAAAQN